MKTKEQIIERLDHAKTFAEDFENPGWKEYAAIANAFCWILGKKDEFVDIATPRFANEK